MLNPKRYLNHLSLPDYRYIPGKGPKDEQRKDIPKFELIPLSEENWKENEAYLYGVDLFNHEFYYEAHEVWEELWHVTGHDTLEGKFLKAMIQLSAIQLKVSLQEKKPAERLRHSACKILLDLSLAEEVVATHYMGFSLHHFIKTLEEGNIPKVFILQTS